MKHIAYSYTILRYVHDVVTGECLNIGVIVCADVAFYLRARIQPEYSRLSEAFGGFNGEYYRKVVKHIEGKINQLASRWEKELKFDYTPADAISAARAVIPEDDSALQLAELGQGITEDLDATLALLFERYVVRNQPHDPKEHRSHEEVWRVFRDKLDMVGVAPKLEPVKIQGSSFEYEFDHAWKNRKWHPLAPISMDAKEGDTLRSRASRWVGTATDIQGHNLLGKLYLLVGEPQNEALINHYRKAIDLLDRMPVEHEIILEDQAEDFARYFSDLIKSHKAEE